MYRTLILLLVGISIANAIVCLPNYCDDVSCDSVSCSSDEEYTEHGTFCGCCPACLKIIRKGESCAFLFTGIGLPPTAKCDEGLMCDFQSLLCE
ncbi:uncharacterized protein TNIN_436311 [Trichonephila inaurata madagascariensis]|uniref:Uncharacterized protein n=1 Tax=Trichonephila inaurata madagascariensis TaxID=2747483 RepID=A0A8X6XTY9_9ARAC|nr:uncharacterized protein TNIN_436311 [Trichonephila inaurata madagascariensis]